MYTSSIRRAAAPFVAAGLLLTLAACPGPNTPDQVDPPPQRRPANLTATFSNAVWSLSPRAQFNFRLAFDLTLRESNGTAARLNFLRVEFRDSGGRFLERQEAGSNILNAIAANGTLSDHITVDFNDGNTSSALVIINATDDTGQTHEMRIVITCC
jgi:hypothetical protein